MYDPYLSDYRAIERLVKDYMKHGQLIIAYDFDNTVFDYHSRGFKFEKIIELLRECRPYAKLIVYTHSNDDRHGEIAEYLDKNDIPYDSINKGLVWVNGKEEGKLFYSHLLDDRAGLRSAYIILDKAIEVIKMNPENEAEACEFLKKRFGKLFDCNDE